MKKRLTIVFIFFLGAAFLFAQQTDELEELKKRVTENYNTFYADLEKSFAEAQSIEKEAIKLNAKKQELYAIEMQCMYYGATKDFEKMLTTGKILYQKAGKYKIPLYQIKAKRYTFEAYIFTGLPDKAFQELEQGNKLISTLNEKDPVVIDEKIRFFSSYANYYYSQGDLQNQLKYALLAGEEARKIPDEKRREKDLCFHYCNIAGTYADLNLMDSAKVYAELSLSMYKETYNRNDLGAINFWTLGKVAEHENDYQKALSYFKKAEKTEGYKNHANLELFYDEIITSYQQLQQEDSVKIYQIKRDSLKLAVAENQKKSLTTLLNEKKENNPVYLYMLTGILGIIAVFTLFVVRKNRILARQEKAGREYLNGLSESHQTSDYAKLLEMLKQNDPAFMACFDEIYPAFTQKLLQINPKIVQSEIEFCALLKLKLPTKDIARYRFIEPATVRNKKFRIKRKFNIPENVDVYQWFDQI